MGSLTGHRMRRIFEAPVGAGVRTNFDVAPYPAGPHGHATFFGGSNLAIFKGSRHKAEAWDLEKYLGGKAAQVQLSLLSSMMPARIDARQRTRPFAESTPYTFPSTVAVKTTPLATVAQPKSGCGRRNVHSFLPVAASRATSSPRPRRKTLTPSSGS